MIIMINENFDVFSENNVDKNEVIEQAPYLLLELHKELRLEK